MKRKRAAPSLRSWFVGIFVICWLLPMAAIMLTSGYFISGGFQDRIRDTAVTSVENALSQMDSRLSDAMDASRAASYDNTIRNAWRVYGQDGDAVELYDSLTSYLVGKYSYNDSFRSALLFFPGGPGDVYSSYNHAISGAASELRAFMENVYPTAEERARELDTGVGFFTVGDSLYMLRNIVDEGFEPYAVLVMECSLPTIFESAEGIVWLSGAEISVDGLRCLTLGAGSGGAAAENSATRLGESHYLVSRSSSASGHKISITAQSNGVKLTEELPSLIAAISLVTAVALILLGLSIWTFGRQVTAPVNALVDAAEHVGAGERGYTVATSPGNREMRRLTDHFNSMSTELKSQFERSYEEQLALQDARIKALQSQINPHFLNNTLEAINWEARMAGNEKVSRMIEALSDLLDAATARGGSAVGPVSEELRYTDSYLYIISERFGERITVRQEVDESLLGVRVPKLILQPIVENAVEHGVAKRSRGELLLRIYGAEGSAVMEVEHDGVMTDADREAIARLLNKDAADGEEPDSRRVGIRNVDRRLRLLYGEGSGLTITEKPEGRVLARIIVPIAQK